MRHRPIEYGSAGADASHLRVYLNVLRQALEDLESAGEPGSDKRGDFDEALSWFEYGGEGGLADVAIVISMCGISGEMLYERVARKLGESGQAASERLSQIRLRLEAGERLGDIDNA